MPFTGNSRFRTAALALVLLLHAAGIWLLAMHATGELPAPPADQREFVLVQIKPPRPAAPAVAPPRETPRRTVTAPIRAPVRTVPEAITAITPETVLPPAAEAAPEAPPAMDVEALKRSVRTMKLEETLAEKARKQVGTPLQSEMERTGQGIARAKRGDCLRAFSGAGLLAPLAMAYAAVTDKKDNGCKF